MGKILERAEYCFTVITLLLYTGGLLLLLLSGGANEADIGMSYDTSLYRFSFILIYLITIVLLLLRWKQALYTLSRSPLIVVLLTLAGISIFWSSMPDATLKESTMLIGSSLFGFYLATRYSLKQQLELISWTFGIVILLSFLFAVALPSYGKMGGNHAGSWRGIFMHKNGLGATMVSSVMAFLLLSLDNPRYRGLSWLSILLSMVLIIFSKSTSSLVNTIFIGITILVLQMIRWHYRSMVAAFMSFLLILEISAVILIGNAQSLANALGKDLTLTGRTVLWEAVWERVLRQPWFGYGYGGFWNAKSEVFSIWVTTGWKMNHPHNGFMALLLDLGFVGLTILLVALSQSFYRALLLARLESSAAAFLPVASLFFLITSNLTESDLVGSNSFNWLLYVSLTLTVIKSLERRATEFTSDQTPTGLLHS